MADIAILVAEEYERRVKNGRKDDDNHQQYCRRFSLYFTEIEVLENENINKAYLKGFDATTKGMSFLLAFSAICIDLFAQVSMPSILVMASRARMGPLTLTVLDMAKVFWLRSSALGNLDEAALDQVEKKAADTLVLYEDTTEATRQKVSSSQALRKAENISEMFSEAEAEAGPEARTMTSQAAKYPTLAAKDPIVPEILVVLKVTSSMAFPILSSTRKPTSPKAAAAAIPHP
ncbi:hypothetical protein D8674_000253 [Pyrus ussuriensis x Pyrus communis]|uniref:Uncharacterized protein n=1 Tax=Pyrus ussuriensis x Pyrus communis TaxID=2448454 RepID=A0A5N5F3I3_9ROSA|nr:hypothetical protein D8674_000253 [Pyrus ussuriensis x Pyrus communis]